MSAAWFVLGFLTAAALFGIPIAAQRRSIERLAAEPARQHPMSTRPPTSLDTRIRWDE